MRSPSKDMGSKNTERVLARLAGGAVLCQNDAGEFHLYADLEKRERPLFNVEKQLVKKLLRDELLIVAALSQPGNKENVRCPQQGGVFKDRNWKVFRLSEVGHMQVKRRQAGGQTPFAAQHRQMETRYIDSADKANRYYRVNAGESPLGWLRTRKDADGKSLINETQYLAGETLRKDYTLGKLTPQITTNWRRFFNGSADNHRHGESRLLLTDAIMEARDRVHKALVFVGAGLAEVLLETCCYLHGMEQAERNLGWPRRSGKVVLLIALDRLAHHYGLQVEALAKN